MASVWFITGVSSGFGLEIALQALERGCKVFGTVRSRQRAAPAVESIESRGGKCLELDVTDADACFRILNEVERLGGERGIDVLVNNAGMSYLGAIEDFSDEEAKAQMDVNFHGPLRLIRAALPGMRRKKSGTIVNVTSIAGVDALPCSGMYSASKFAFEGLSEALARETAEHGIQVLIVEPGAFRTNFLGSYQVPAKSGGENYSVVKAGLEKFSQMNGTQAGDTVKGATRIVEVISGSGMGGGLKGKILRLPLGPDCVKRYETKVKTMQADLDKAREVAMSTDIA